MSKKESRVWHPTHYFWCGVPLPDSVVRERRKRNILHTDPVDALSCKDFDVSET